MEISSPFRLAIAALSVSLLLACGDSAQKNAEEAARHISRAEVYQKQGQFRAALIEARNAVRIDPDSDKSIITMASLMLNMGDERGVIDFLGERASDNPERLKLLATAYTRLGKFRSAAKVIDGIEAANRDIEWELLRARGLSGIGNIDEARALLNRIREQNPQYAEADLRLAQLALLEQQSDEAQQLIETAIAKDPSSTESYFTRATLDYQRNDLDAAATSLTEALSNTVKGDILTAERTRVLRLLVQVLTEMGRSNEALAYQKLLAENNPEYLKNQNQLADALELYRQGDLKSAEDILSELYQSNPGNNASALLLGMINFQNREFDAARSLFDSHLDAELASPQLISAAALTRVQMQQTEAALTLLEESLQSHPDSADLWSLYGLMLMNSADSSEKGLMAVEKALALDPDRTRLRMVLANYHTGKKNYAQALAQLDQVLARTPDDAAAQTNYLRILLAEQRLNEAEKFIDDIASRQGDDNFTVLLLRASLAGSKDDNAGVERFLERAAAANTKAAGPLLALAQLNVRQQAWAKVEGFFIRALARDPDRHEAYQGIIASHEARKTTDKGLAIVNQAATTGENITARAVMADYYSRNGKVKQAAGFIEQWTPSNDYQLSVHKRFHLLESRELAAAGDFGAAVATIRSALQQQPQDLDLLVMLGRLQVAQKAFPDAAGTADSIAGIQGKEPFANELRGDSLAAQGKKPLAVERYRAAWEVRPSPVLARKIMTLLRESGETAAAEKFNSDWADTLPGDPAPLLSRANQLQTEGNCKAAIPIYEQLLETLPERSTLLVANNLAICYLDAGDPRALATAKLAYDLGPKLGAVADTYGWILYKTGDRKAGLKLLEEAAKLSPENKEIAAHLAEAKRG